MKNQRFNVTETVNARHITLATRDAARKTLGSPTRDARDAFEFPQAAKMDGSRATLSGVNLEKILYRLSNIRGSLTENLPPDEQQNREQIVSTWDAAASLLNGLNNLIAKSEAFEQSIIEGTVHRGSAASPTTTKTGDATRIFGKVTRPADVNKANAAFWNNQPPPEAA